MCVEEPTKQPSDTQLGEQPDEIPSEDQQEPEPDTQSQVSQVTEATELEASTDEQAHIKTVIALTKIDEEGRRISGDFSALPAIKLISKTSIQSCNYLCVGEVQGVL